MPTDPPTSMEAPPRPVPARGMGRLVPIIAWLIAFGAWCPASLLVWEGRPYTLDLLSHFLPHLAAGWLVVAVILYLMRQRGPGVCVLAAAVALGVGWWAAARAPGASPPRDGSKAIRLVEFNMHEEVSRHDNDAFAWVRDQQPDLIVFIEPYPGLLDDYPYLKREYPVVVTPEPGLMWSIMLLCRFPAEVHPLIEYSEETKYSFASRRSLRVTMEGAEPFLLTALHAPSPRSAQTWERSIELSVLTARIIRDWHARTGTEVIMAGDFNSTPVGRVSKSFARESGLVLWSHAVGGGTWPSVLPPWLALPIDRVWTTEGIRVGSVKVGPRFRSDHRPIVVELAILGDVP